MPRKVQWPPRVRIHKARNLERIYVGGKWVYLGPAGSEEARKEYARIIKEVADGGPPRSPPRKVEALLLVKDVCARWLAQAAPRFRERGREEEQYRLALKPLLRLFGDLPAAHFNTDSLMQLQLAMASGSWLTAAERRNCPMRRRYGAGWCRKLVNQRINRIRAVWRWAELAKLVPEGRFAALKAVPHLAQGTVLARENPEVRPATWEEVRGVVRRCTPVVRAMLLFQWWTGCRSAEVRLMRAGDVDTSDSGCWRYRPRQHKTDYRGHSREIAVGPKAQAVLRSWLAAALQQGPDTLVFPAPRAGKGRGKSLGGCYTRGSYAQAVARAARKAGVRDFRAYRCRHSCRDRVEDVAGIEAARDVLGHRSTRTTEGYGTRTNHAHAADVQRRLG